MTYDVMWHAVPSTQEYLPVALTAMGPQISTNTVVNGSDGSECRVDARLMSATCDLQVRQWGHNDIGVEEIVGGIPERSMVASLEMPAS